MGGMVRWRPPRRPLGIGAEDPPLHGRWIAGIDLMAALLDQEKDAPLTDAEAWHPKVEPSGFAKVIAAWEGLADDAQIWASQAQRSSRLLGAPRNSSRTRARDCSPSRGSSSPHHQRRSRYDGTHRTMLEPPSISRTCDSYASGSGAPSMT